MRNLHEIDKDRYGGRYDGRSINAHSERTFRDPAGNLYRLARNLDEEGRPFQAYGPFSETFRGILPSFQVGSQDSFGAGRSWKSAMSVLDEAVGALKTKDLIMTPDPAELGDWNVIQHGLSGLRVEVWEVSQVHIDRDTWGSWLTEAGWYWQRMDIAEIHGPFKDKDAAVADFRVHRDQPGIKHPADRDRDEPEEVGSIRPR